MEKMVAVYGSARVLPGEAEYQDALAVGQALAKAGYTVMTGGYAGVMAAASEGAAAAGGHVIGVTVRELEAIGESRTNGWVREEIRCDTLRERLYHLVDRPDAYVLMPGGTGTMQELAEVWQQMRMGAIPKRPIICYGDFWPQLLRPMMETRYVGDSDRELLHTVYEPDELVDYLSNWKSEE